MVGSKYVIRAPQSMYRDGALCICGFVSANHTLTLCSLSRVEKADATNGSADTTGNGAAKSNGKSAPSSSEIAKIKEAIQNASSLEEVNALQEKLKDGSWGNMEE
jgi:hypothetical protein